MTLATRTLRLHLLSVLGAPLPGAKVTLQLSSYQADEDDIVPLNWELIEDPTTPGDYVGPIWPNTRNNSGTHYDMLVQASGQQLLTELVTVTVGTGEAVLKSKINPAPYPPVYGAAKAVGDANIFANASGESASRALAAVATINLISEAYGDVAAAAATAVDASEISTAAKDVALASKIAAEAARDGALIQAGLYETEATGRAAVTDGQAFKVQGSGDVAAYEYRRIDSATSVLVATYPSASAIAYATPVFADDPLHGEDFLVNDKGEVLRNFTAESPATFDVFGDDPLYLSGAVLDEQGKVVVAGSGSGAGAASELLCGVPVDGHVYAVGPAGAVKISSPIGIANSPQSHDGKLYWLDGDSYRAMPINGMEAVPDTITSILFLPLIGQSKVVGASLVTGAVSTDSPAPDRAFTFSGGAHPMQEADCLAAPAGLVTINDDRLGALIPHVERVHGPLNFGETPGAGMVYSLAATLPATTAVVFGTFGVGSAMLAQLGPTTNPYRNMIRAAERVRAWCALSGRAFTCPVLVFDQGEGDVSLSTPPATYTATLLALQAAFNADIDAIAGVSTARPVVMPQMSAAAHYGISLNTLIASTLDASIANPTKLKISHPQYFNPQFDTAGVHMTPLGYRIEGEYDGRSVARVIAGSEPTNLRMTAVSNAGTAITITTNALTQLVKDTALVTDPGQNGLVLRKVSDDSDVALSAIAVSGSNQITATAAAALTVGQDYYIGSAYYLSVAGTPNAGPTTGHRTNFRDSSADLLSSVAGGTSKFNWLAIQRFEFTAA